MDVDTSPDRICIRIADIAVAISSTPGLALELDKSCRPFGVAEVLCDVNIRAAWRDLSTEQRGERIFDSGGAWKLYRKNQQLSFHFISPPLGPIPYKVAVFDRDLKTGEVYLHFPYFDSTKPVYPLQYPLDELLILSLLSRGSGVEVHACGVVDARGNGYLFAGHSGAGKTTMARLWEKEPGAKVLNDDRIILRRSEGQLWIYGTPWHGEAEFAVPARAPATRVFFLRHGSEKLIRPMAGADAAARFFSYTFPTFHDPEGLEFTLRFLDEVGCVVPISELSVVPDEKMVEFIQQAQVI